MRRSMVIAALLGSLAAPAYPAESSLVGLWVLTPEARERFAAPCHEMTLEFTKDRRIVRKTGGLIYTTSVLLNADGNGWLMKETLESENGKPGCGGKAAEEVISHLQHDAYVEVAGARLRYYGVKGARRVIEFQRADAQKDLALPSE